MSISLACCRQPRSKTLACCYRSVQNTCLYFEERFALDAFKAPFCSKEYFYTCCRQPRSKTLACLGGTQKRRVDCGGRRRKEVVGIFCFHASHPHISRSVLGEHRHVSRVEEDCNAGRCDRDDVHEVQIELHLRRKHVFERWGRKKLAVGCGGRHQVEVCVGG